MSRSRPTYGSRSLAACGLMLVETQAFHPLMVQALARGQTAAWLLMLSAGLTAAVAIWPIAAMLRRLPGKTIVEAADLTLGRGAAIITGLLLCGALSFMGGMILRETSEMAISLAYPHTPQTYATVTLLLGAVYVAWGDGAQLVRLCRVLLPGFVASLLFIMTGSVGWGKLAYLRPLWGPGLPALLVNVPSVASFYAPLVLIPLLTDGVADRRQAGRWLPGAALACAILTCLQVVILTMVYPYPLGSSYTFPFHVAARIVLGGRFFERLEAVWLLMWVASTVILSGALLYGSSLAFTQAFRMPRHTVALPALAATVLAIAFFPHNQAETVHIHGGAAPVIATVTLLLPAVIALVAVLRTRRRHVREA